MAYIAHGNRLNTFIEAGKDGRQWYDAVHTSLTSIFESDADLVCDLLAATSPNTSVKGNATLALKAYQQIKNGKPFTGYMPTVIDMLEVIKHNYETGECAPFGGDKVRNFAAALKGDLNAVVVDRWILRAFGFPAAPTPKRLAAIKAWIERKAKALAWRPAQVQAAIWCGIKEREDTSGLGTDSFTVYFNSEVC